VTAYARFLVRHAKAILAALALLTGIALHGIVDLRDGRLRLEVYPSLD
jgi:hypothetical protein